MGFIPTSNNGTNISTVGSSSYSNITKLKGLKDVTLTEPINTGELLAYDADDDQWKNTTSIPITRISNFNISFPEDKQVLQYDINTNRFINSTLSSLSTALSTLTDCVITSPSTGQVLKYNSTSSKWENATDTDALSSLSDVTISNPTDNQVIIYSSLFNKWMNATYTVVKSLSTLTDVNVSSLASGNLLEIGRASCRERV